MKSVMRCAAILLLSCVTWSCGGSQSSLVMEDNMSPEEIEAQRQIEQSIMQSGQEMQQQLSQSQPSSGPPPPPR